MVRGSFSASFPVIAVIISPTFTRRYPDNNRKKDQAGALGWKRTSEDQDRRTKKKRKDEEMDPFVVAFQVSRGGRAAPVLSSRVIAAYC